MAEPLRQHSRGHLPNDDEAYPPNSHTIRWLQALSIYLHRTPNRVTMPSGRQTDRGSLYDAAIRLAALAIKSDGDLRGRKGGTPYTIRQLIQALGVSNDKAMDILRWMEEHDWMLTEKGANQNEVSARMLFINENEEQAPPGWPLS